MNKFFIVTGLPRSRTTWLAAFLSDGKTICFHEPVASHGGDPDKAFESVVSAPYERIGISDSSIPRNWNFYQAVFGYDAPVVVVRRDLEECLVSHEKYFGVSKDKLKPVFHSIQHGLVQMRLYFKEVLTVDFEKLDDMKVLRSIWKFCCHSEEFSETRAKIFSNIICNQRIPR